MELLVNTKDLEDTFLTLMEKYSSYYWLTAWAGINSLPYEELSRNKIKIEKIVVGLHFYQTHPDFIESFLSSKKVKYIKQPDGTFHPKLYLFFNNRNDWALIVGSANFTNAAFTGNTEVSTLITSLDSDSSRVFEQAFKVIDEKWKEADYFSKSELLNYRNTWQNIKTKINSLSGNYDGRTNNAKIKSKPIFQVSIHNMSWKEYVDKVKRDKYHSLKERLKLLDEIRSFFTKYGSFDKFSLEERKFTAGIPNKLSDELNVDSAFFGSMKGAGKYKNKIITNDINISNALDEIPLSGQITQKHYFEFLTHYKKAFTGNYIATATRLLAMKRPDVFVCLDSKNKLGLCKDFGLKPSVFDYDLYWGSIVENIFISEWWMNPKPRNEEERRIDQYRAALLDSLYYQM